MFYFMAHASNYQTVEVNDLWEQPSHEKDDFKNEMMFEMKLMSSTKVFMECHMFNENDSSWINEFMQTKLNCDYEHIILAA